MLFTIALGGLTSLMIEVLQAYLPSRDSSLLDVIDDAFLGTLLGAALQIAMPSSAVRRSKIALQPEPGFLRALVSNRVIQSRQPQDTNEVFAGNRQLPDRSTDPPPPDPTAGRRL